MYSTFLRIPNIRFPLGMILYSPSSGGLLTINVIRRKHNAACSLDIAELATVLCLAANGPITYASRIDATTNVFPLRRAMDSIALRVACGLSMTASTNAAWYSSSSSGWPTMAPSGILRYSRANRQTRSPTVRSSNGFVFHDPMSAGL